MYLGRAVGLSTSMVQTRSPSHGMRRRARFRRLERSSRNSRRHSGTSRRPSRRCGSTMTRRSLRWPARKRKTRCAWYARALLPLVVLADDLFFQIHLPSLTAFGNWPTSSTPLGHVTAVDFSARSEYVAIGNTRGRVLLYHLKDYGAGGGVSLNGF